MGLDNSPGRFEEGEIFFALSSTHLQQIHGKLIRYIRSPFPIHPCSARHRKDPSSLLAPFPVSQSKKSSGMNPDKPVVLILLLNRATSVMNRIKRGVTVMEIFIAKVAILVLTIVFLSILGKSETTASLKKIEQPSPDYMQNNNWE